MTSKEPSSDRTKFTLSPPVQDENDHPASASNNLDAVAADSQDDTESSSQENVEATLRHVTSLASAARTVLAGLTSLLALFYIVGYLSINKYYGAFNADWLTSEVSLRKVAAFGIQPLALMGFIAFFALAREIEPSRRMLKYAARFGRLIWYLAFAAILINSVMNFWGGQLYNSAYDSFIILLIWSGMMAEVVGRIFQPRPLGFDLPTFNSIVAIFFYGLLFSIHYGTAVGRVASTPGLSTLPIAELKDVSEKSWRLVAYVNDNLVIVNFGEKSDQPIITRVVDFTDVTTLRAPNNLELRPEKKRGPIWPFKSDKEKISATSPTMKKITPVKQAATEY